MHEIFDSAIDLAQRAGKITLDYFCTDLNIESKSDDSPVTIADRKTEEFLRNEIEKRYPDDAILGEEFGEKEGRSGLRWILDPIDGTKTFIRGVPMYGTMIAIERGGESRVGVIHFPPLDETIAALSGNGCYWNGERCGVSQTEALSEASIMTTSMDSILDCWGEQILLRILKETGFQRTWADCYGYLLVATGRADACVDPIMHIWDVAPLIPIVQEAGGRLTDLSGGQSLEMTNMMASNGRIHKAFLDLLNGR